GHTASDIRARIERDFGYDLSMSVEELQRRYSWQGIDGKGDGGICQDSVPQAIICVLQAKDFEDAIRNAISIGGDSDTIGCIAGGIAEALYASLSRLKNEHGSIWTRPKAAPSGALSRNTASKQGALT
ncbi:MAG: ADP-ribosylglycohydrolase family protein, partial [Porphyromonas pasteri]